ncbi:GPW/gp25 family protein [Paraburkholderia bonniea]|uniref:GPW/gp25 family protein n=1 Tax=Paraburkholderia bonniea TaxID=2152891 RepID=UPI001290D1CE|nr:GPW/gp25 family protein [Paraburkholderia bonniea]
MIGMNAQTGRSISGHAHLYQSIAKILTTPLATRIKRRHFGSEIPDLLDAANNGTTRVRLYAAIATALLRWEPRLKLTRVLLTTDGQSGHQYVDIEGIASEAGEPVSARVPVFYGSGK